MDSSLCFFGFISPAACGRQIHNVVFVYRGDRSDCLLPRDAVRQCGSQALGLGNAEWLEVKSGRVPKVLNLCFGLL